MNPKLETAICIVLIVIVSSIACSFASLVALGIPMTTETMSQAFGGWLKMLTFAAIILAVFVFVIDLTLIE